MKARTALSILCMLSATSLMATSLDELVEQYIDLKTSPAATFDKLVGAFTLDGKVDTLKTVEQSKNKHSSISANLELLSACITFSILEYRANFENVDMWAPHFAELRAKLMESLERNCEETGQQTSCTNAFYFRMKGSSYKVIPLNERNDTKATIMLTHARGRRSAHFLETAAGVLSAGIGCEPNEAAAQNLRSLSPKRAPFMLTSRAYEFALRPEFRTHFSPWLRYTEPSDDLVATSALITQIVRVDDTQLIAKIREVLNDIQTRQLIIDFYVECLLSTTNLSAPRTGWTSSQGDFAWKAAMDHALDEESKAEARARAQAEIARLIAVDGSSASEINSVRADIRARFKWSADDADYEHIVQGTAFAR